MSKLSESELMKTRIKTAEELQKQLDKLKAEHKELKKKYKDLCSEFNLYAHYGSYVNS